MSPWASRELIGCNPGLQGACALKLNGVNNHVKCTSLAVEAGLKGGCRMFWVRVALRGTMSNQGAPQRARSLSHNRAKPFLSNPPMKHHKVVQ